MTLYSVKPAFQRGLDPVLRVAMRRRISANQLTVTAVLLSLAGGIALALSSIEPRLLLLTFPVVLGRLALNALDGMVARRSATASPAGELLNEVGDRLGDLFLLGGLVISGHGDWRLGALALATITLPGSVGVTARAAGGARRYEGPLSKPDRMAALGAAGALTLVLPVDLVVSGLYALLVVGATLTAANRYRHAHHELSTRRGDAS